MSGQQAGFIGDLVAQSRAGDTYGQLDRLADDALLRPYLVSREQKRAIAVDCDVPPLVAGRLRSFYQAVCVGAERASGVVTDYVLDLSHEGFGRVVLFAGRLVILSDVLRDVQRFGFESTEELAAQGESLVAAAAKAVEAYPEVARDDHCA